METSPYFSDEHGRQNEDFYQEPNVFSGQQANFDQWYFPDQILYPALESADILAGLPFLFGDLPYPADFPVPDLPLEQSVSRTDYSPPYPEYTNFNTTAFSGPWLEPGPLLTSFPPAETLSPSYGTPRTPYESSPMELSPSTSRSTEYDGYRSMTRSTSLSGPSTPSFPNPRPKRKASDKVLYSDSESQAFLTHEEPAVNKVSLKPPRSPRTPVIRKTEPQTIDLPKSKKLRGLPASLITVFDANTKPLVKRNTRRSYTDEARKKVEDVRKIGACSQCRFRKRTCGTGWPCHSCIRRSDSLEMAERICIRESSAEDGRSKSLSD